MERGAVHGWDDDRGDSAAKVRSAAPKRSPHRCGRPSESSSATKSSSRQTAASSSTSIPGRMPSARWYEAHRERPPVAERAVLPARHALVVEAQHQLALGKRVDVHEPPPLRPQLLVQPPAEALDLVASVRLCGKEPMLRRRARIDPRRGSPPTRRARRRASQARVPRPRHPRAARQGGGCPGRGAPRDRGIPTRSRAHRAFSQ